MAPFTLLEKFANPLEAIQVKPFAPSGGAVAGGLYGAGYGGAAGGGIGILKALLDSEDDGVKSTVMKALKGSAIGAGLGGLAGAGYGASNRDEVTESVVENLVKKHRKSLDGSPIGDPFGLREKAIREAASEQLPKLKVPLGKLINKMLNEGAGNIVYPSEKSANIARLGSQLSRAFKGLKAAPADFASLATGRGMPSVAKELGRAGQLGNLAGHAALQTGMFMGVNKLINGGAKDSTGEQKPNNGNALGAIHPDLKRMLDAGVATGIAGAQQNMGDRTISYEDFRKLMEKNKLKPGERGTGLRPPSKPFFNNPFTTEGRSRIATGLKNANESMSPLMKREELIALYGEGPAAQFKAMTDPFRMQKRMQYREGNQ
jgi:hypothetical protein